MKNISPSFVWIFFSCSRLVLTCGLFFAAQYLCVFGASPFPLVFNLCFGSSIVYYLVQKISKSVSTNMVMNGSQWRVLILCAVTTVFHLVVFMYGLMYFGLIRMLMMEICFEFLMTIPNLKQEMVSVASLPSFVTVPRLISVGITISILLVFSMINCQSTFSVVTALENVDAAATVASKIDLGSSTISPIGSDFSLLFKLFLITIIIFAMYADTRRKIIIKKYYKEFGGPKRFQAMTFALSSVLILPFLLFNSAPLVVIPIYRVALISTIVIVAVGVNQIFVENGVAIQLDLNMAHLISNISKMTIAFILDFAYSFTSASGYGSISDVTSCSIVVILLPFILVISEIFFRYSSVSSVLPQYVTPAVTSTVTLSNNFSNVKQIYRTLMEETQTRQILIFVVINFSFMFVEFTYGLATNSLSLISDSGHMFIDCMGLVIGLYAAYLAKLKPNDKYTFGYGRYETLSGFVNGIFLLFIAYFVIIEALERFINPPEIHGEQLILVAVLGFVVNIFGLIFFHEHHAHATGECAHSHGSNHNMRGIYIHILADTLGSLGVIISTILIRYFDWMIFDPICSIFISILIVLSVWPLVRDSGKVLLHVTPPKLFDDYQRALHQVLLLDSVFGYREPRFWVHSTDSTYFSLIVNVDNNSDHNRLLKKVTEIFHSSHVHIKNLTIQFESSLESGHSYTTLESLGLTKTDVSNEIIQHDSCCHDTCHGQLTPCNTETVTSDNRPDVHIRRKSSTPSISLGAGPVTSTDTISKYFAEPSDDGFVLVRGSPSPTIEINIPSNLNLSATNLASSNDANLISQAINVKRGKAPEPSKF